MSTGTPPKQPDSTGSTQTNVNNLPADKPGSDASVTARAREDAGLARAWGVLDADKSSSNESDLTTQVPMDLAAGGPGDIIPGYVILQEIHRGGQGIVFQALQQSTKRKVAIKVLLGGTNASESVRKRFEREIELVAQLDHPQIVRLFHSGQTSDGRQYFVMDYVRGQPLDQYIRDKKLPLEDTLVLFRTVCEAVHYAHHRGVVHRDLKPSNILVDSSGQPKILDFGLAKQLTGTQEVLVSLTGQVVGTLRYMSPEQARGNPDEIDIRTDVYALGVILYEVLTGAYPYPIAGHEADILKIIAETPPTPPSKNWKSDVGIVERIGRPLRIGQCPIDAELQTIVLRTLAKEKDRRYQTAAALADDLKRYLAGEPIMAKRDSHVYVLRKRGVAVLQRHKVSAFIAVIAIGSLGYLLGKSVVYDWTNTHRRFTQFMVDHFSPVRFESALNKVRVVAITDQTDVEELARKEGLSDVSREPWASVRRLHGRLFEKLARSKARAVVSDIGFSTESKFDEDLVKGIRTLHSADVPVTIVVKTWADTEGVPKLSKTVASDVSWGSSCADFGAGGPWKIQLAMQRDQADVLPSLALAAYANHLQPTANVDYVLDEPGQMVHLRFWKPDTAVSRAKHRLADEESRHIRVVIKTQVEDNSELTLKTDDLLGLLVMELPPDPVLENSTIEYSRVMSADDATLRQMFEGKIIVLGDMQSGKDRHKRPDGSGNVAGCHGQAVGLDTLLRRSAYLESSMLGDWTLKSLTALAAGLGCVAALATAGRSRRRRLTILVLTMVGLLATIVAFRQFYQLYNPLVPIFALVVASELAAFVQRVHGSPGR